MPIQKTIEPPEQVTEAGHHLATLLRQKPKTKSGQVQFLWPQIKAALREGHTIKEVWESLNRDGLDLSYSRLRYYVARLRRREASAADVPNDAREPREHSTREDIDPALNLRERLEKRPGFHWDESPPDLKKLV